MNSVYIQWLWWENWIWSEHGLCLPLGWWQSLHWWVVGLELMGPKPEPGVSKGFPVLNGFYHLIRGRHVAGGAGTRVLRKWVSPVCDGNFWIILGRELGAVLFSWLCAGFAFSLVCKSLLWWLSGKKVYQASRRSGSDSWVRKVLWSRKWQPTSVFLAGQSHEQRKLVGYSPWGHKRVRHDLTTKYQQPHLSLWLGSGEGLVPQHRTEPAPSQDGQECALWWQCSLPWT